MRVAIVLAAGSSRRFGCGVKLLAKLDGKILLYHAIDRAHVSGAGRVLVVTGAARGRIERATRAAGVRSIFASAHRRGMGASLQAGLRAVRPIEREVAIFLGDMPFADDPHRWRLRAGLDALRPIYRGVPGHPLLIRTKLARRLVTTGDEGLATALGRDRIGVVRGAAGAIRDIDRRAELRRLRWRTPRR